MPVPFVDLYDQGYGRDAAGIAKNAIEHGALVSLALRMAPLIPDSYS